MLFEVTLLVLEHDPAAATADRTLDLPERTAVHVFLLIFLQRVVLAPVWLVVALRSRVLTVLLMAT